MWNAFRCLSYKTSRNAGNVKHVKRKSLRTREMLEVASLFRLEGPKTWEMLNMLNENLSKHGKC